MKLTNFGLKLGAASLALSLALAGPACAGQKKEAGKWITGDWHQHTVFTDGSNIMGDIQIDKTKNPPTFTILEGSAVTDPKAIFPAGTYKGVIPQGFRYGLDFQANSEHGGNRGARDGFGRYWVAVDGSTDLSFYPAAADIPLLGINATYSNTCDYNNIDSPGCTSPAHKIMWRWQELFASADIKPSSYMSAFDWITELRHQYRDKHILTGMEWNVPGHEHASTGCLENSGKCIAEFEFRFDQNDTDTDAGPAMVPGLNWTGKIQTSAYTTPAYPDYSTALGLNTRHNKAIDGLKWLNDNHPTTSWVNPAHIERAGCGVWNPTTLKWDNGSGATATSVGYSIAAIRDMNDNAPTVFFGFEGMPGHQKAVNRGEVSGTSCGGGTYGGAGTYIATVGGVWDNLLADGRKIFNFVSSDFHMTQDDFYPGEYAKTYVNVKNDDRRNDNERWDDRKREHEHEGRGPTFTQQDILDGMRSGNSFAVHGDLINKLDFRVFHGAAKGAKVDHGKNSATMGETLSAERGDKITIQIRFKSPSVNNNNDKPVVHHVQLIQGRINPTKESKFINNDPISPNPSYNTVDPSVAKIVATFDKDASSTNPKWTTGSDGYTTMIFTVKNVQDDMFFRIRGTNLGYGVNDLAYGTDAAGNPLKNNPGTNTAAKAWEDLWFYSNPIFVKVH